MRAAGQEPLVGVEHGVVLGRPEHAEQAALVRARILEQAERLVGVGRDDDAVEPPHLIARDPQLTPPSTRRSSGPRSRGIRSRSCSART